MSQNVEMYNELQKELDLLDVEYYRVSKEAARLRSVMADISRKKMDLWRQMSADERGEVDFPYAREVK